MSDMLAIPWTPWHEVVQLRDDLRSGDLSLTMFAADLHKVAVGEGESVYRDPQEFFALTYATHNLLDLARDMVWRLHGKSDKAVRQLELTYGGGKTHTLITLYHLVRDPKALPDLPAVREFRQHADIEFPQARVAGVAIDPP
jgi:predicted AAA+ superfamily ATPase